MSMFARITHGIRYWLLRRLPTCKQTVAVISESFERQLSLRERISVKLHLWICIWCVWYFEHLHLMRSAIKSKAAQVPEMKSSSPPLSDAARERIKRRLSSGG